MNKWQGVKLVDIFEKPISDEWGKDNLLNIVKSIVGMANIKT